MIYSYFASRQTSSICAITNIFLVFTILYDEYLKLSITVAADELYKKKCLKDDTVPEYPVNVYYCYEEWKSECCVRDLQYTCCEPDESEITYVSFDCCSSTFLYTR